MLCAVLSRFSHVQFFATPWTIAYQAPLSMGILQLLVNSSRAIIYADKTENFAAVAREEARKVQEEMAAELIKYGIL